MTIYIVGCGATKAPTAQPAELLYIGNHFQASLSYARAQAGAGDQVWIFSAKHGLLALDTPVAPYDVRWGHLGAITFSELRAQIQAQDWFRERLVLLCPARYATRLLDVYRDLHCEHAVHEAPLLGMGIGHQVVWLKRQGRGKVAA